MQLKKRGTCTNGSSVASCGSGDVVHLGPGLRALALAVMRQAVEDAQLDPKMLRHKATAATRRGDAKLQALRLLAWREEALDFLEGRGSTIWLTVLGVDPKVFQRQWEQIRVSLPS